MHFLFILEIMTESEQFTIRYRAFSILDSINDLTTMVATSFLEYARLVTYLPFGKRS